jgi:hypothetical protein
VNTVAGSTRTQWAITAGEQLRSTELTGETNEAQGRLDRIIQLRVGKINELLAGTPHVITPNPTRVVP